jgi:hypothetical protein
MKKLCLTLGAMVLLSLAAMAQTTPVQEQEKMSEPEQSTEINPVRGDGVGKAEDTDQPESDEQTTNQKDRKTVKDKEKKNKVKSRDHDDEDETGKKSRTKKESPQ